MLLSLLLSALAAEPTTEAATYDRLFSEAPTAESISAPAAEPGPSLSSWTLPLGLLGLAAGVLLYKRAQDQKSAPNRPALRLLQRQSLGDRNALVLVEVSEPDGTSRRLLIGTGSGAPVLLSDLGMVEEVPANTAMPESKPEAKVEPKTEAKLELKPEVKPESKLEKKTEIRANEPPRFEMPRAAPPNIADEILAERKPSSSRIREFSKILARIGED